MTCRNLRNHFNYLYPNAKTQTRDARSKLLSAHATNPGAIEQLKHGHQIRAVVIQLKMRTKTKC